MHSKNQKKEGAKVKNWWIAIFVVLFFVPKVNWAQGGAQVQKKYLAIGTSPVNPNRPLEGRVRVAVPEIEVLSQDKKGNWVRGWLQFGEVLAGFFTPDSTFVKADWIVRCGNPVLRTDGQTLYIRVRQKANIEKPKVLLSPPITDIFSRETTLLRIEMPAQTPSQATMNNLPSSRQDHSLRNILIGSGVVGVLGGSLLLLHRALAKDSQISVVINNLPPSGPAPGPASTEEGPNQGNAKFLTFFPASSSFFSPANPSGIGWGFKMEFTVLKF